MCDAITILYTINITDQSINLRGQLRNIKMTKNDIVASYFVKISQIRDQLKAIGEEVSDKELVAMALGGLPRSWDPFATNISARENAPSFDKLWASCTKKESRLHSRDPIEDTNEEALAVHSKKNKRRPNFERFQRSSSRRPNLGYSPRKEPTPRRGPSPSQDTRDRIDLTNVQCYRYQAYGHYQYHCPQRNQRDDYRRMEIERGSNMVLLLTLMNPRGGLRKEILMKNTHFILLL